MSRKPPAIVTDPELPPDVRELLINMQTTEFRVHGLRELPPLGEGEVVARPPLVPGKVQAVVGAGVVLAVLVTVAAGWGPVGFAVLLAIVLLAGAGMVVWWLDVRERRYRALIARSAHDRYVLPEDLDKESLKLLARAHQAVRTVLRSKVHASGTLDHIRNEVVLPRVEWEIASLLRGVSELRSRHPELAGKDNGGQAANVMAATVSSIRQRVATLEEYAEQVKAADAAALLTPAEARHSADDIAALTAQARAAIERLRDVVDLPEIS